jgi:hypothetical protein
MALLLLGCAGAPWPALAPDRSVALQARAAAAMGLTFPPDTRFLVLRRASDGPALFRLDDIHSLENRPVFRLCGPIPGRAPVL